MKHILRVLAQPSTSTQHSQLVSQRKFIPVQHVQLCFGLISAAAWLHFVERLQPSFAGWGDVFFFCGPHYEFCTCHFAWNILGALFKHSCIYVPRLAFSSFVRSLAVLASL